MTRRPRQTTKRSRTLAFIDFLRSQPDVDLDDISFVNRDPEPNWEQARNDHSKPIAPNPPIPFEFLYYDRNMKAYVYDPNRKPHKIVLELSRDVSPTDAAYHWLTKQFPEWLPIPYDVPIGVEISVQHRRTGSTYQMGESATEWIKWITGHFEGSVWISNNQIVAMGVEVRNGIEDMATITIVMA